MRRNEMECIKAWSSTRHSMVEDTPGNVDEDILGHYLKPGLMVSISNINVLCLVSEPIESRHLSPLTLIKATSYLEIETATIKHNNSVIYHRTVGPITSGIVGVMSVVLCCRALLSFLVDSFWGLAERSKEGKEKASNIPKRCLESSPDVVTAQDVSPEHKSQVRESESNQHRLQWDTL
ncbi:hypothetical protein J6590_033850 [Homalodisca vitripennis]|nr:hypothetical protein J6590_033850 [Homalodisca vitripennis]